MFSYIKGEVILIKSEFAVIDAGGIGYKINMPVSQSGKLKIGEIAKIFTYMYIREGILDLYGCVTEDALETFELLISVSGVGPKAAVSLLSVMDPSELTSAVASGDYKIITKTPGIGGKTAQRIVLELKDKLKTVGTDAGVSVSHSVLDSNTAAEAVGALIALGYQPSVAQDAVSRAEPSDDTSALIKNALKMLM